MRSDGLERRSARTARAILFLVIGGLLLRVAFALFYWVGQPLTHDEREYLALARSVARGDGFTYPADEPSPGTGQQFGRAPGYPVFLAALVFIYEYSGIAKAIGGANKQS